MRNPAQREARPLTGTRRPKRWLKGLCLTKKIRSRFENATATVRPLEFQIDSTDQMIDQIVYHLCALTEQEVHLVEEASKNEGPSSSDYALRVFLQ